MANRIIMAAGLVVAAVYLYGAGQIPTTVGDPIGPRTFPYLIALGLIASIAWLFVEHVRERRPALDLPAGPEDAGPSAQATRPLMLGLVVLGTGVYYLLLEPVGFVVSTSLYLFALSTVLDRTRMLLNALVAVGFAVLLLLLFTKALQTSLPKGLIFS